MTFRTKIFTPHALTKFHRDLIYKPTRHKLLLNDPGVTVTMSDNEELRLLPMNSHDRPNKKHSLRRLLELLQVREDWDNLPAFLEGMTLAGEALPKGYMEKLVRRSNEQGLTGTIIRCAERVKKTGVTLSDPQVTTELMLGIHLKAVRSGFEGEEMEDAVRLAKDALVLMAKPEHCGGNVWKQGEQDMRKDITVLGVMLELLAAQADEKVGDIIFGTIPKAASKIMAKWPQQDLTINENPGLARLQMERWLPLWAGMKLAINAKSLEDPKLRSDVKQALQALTKAVEEAKVKVETASQGRPRRCLHMYNDLKDL
jgi:hypothetical protein